jgi:hypothetical protein
LSQDKFWEQWGAAGKPGEQAKQASGQPGEGSPDADALAAWLKEDAIVPPVPPAGAKAPSAAGDLSTAWPPSSPVDPFAGIQGAGTPIPADWDLAFDDEPAGSAAGGAAAGAPALDDFAVGGAGAPAPGLQAPQAAPVPPPASPFGPPPPPYAPPPEALQAGPLKLSITVGRRTFDQVVQGEALIGRPDATRGLHPEIDLRQDDAVSRRHAKIFVRNGRYVLTDLNSTNGTRYNRDWLHPEVEVPLKPGDEIELGEQTVIRVVEAPDSHA